MSYYDILISIEITKCLHTLLINQLIMFLNLCFQSFMVNKFGHGDTNALMFIHGLRSVNTLVVAAGE